MTVELLLTVLVVVFASGVIMQLITILAWRFESREKDVTSTLQGYVIRADKLVAQIDRALGVAFRHWLRLSEQYGWIVGQRVFTLFAWGIAASALSALARETDDWQLSVTSTALFVLHGIASGESLSAAQKHFLSKAKTRNGSRPRAGLLARILGFLTSLLILSWMVTVFAKIIPTMMVSAAGPN